MRCSISRRKIDQCVMLIVEGTGGASLKQNWAMARPCFLQTKNYPYASMAQALSSARIPLHELRTHSPPSAPCTTVFKFQPVVSPSQTPLDKTNGHGGTLAIRTKKKESG
jgi:hypothetical protein